ncbi:hypothetical protein GCM10010319_56410 [Streptomyces blastmyceticus]|uniref:Uncharacterized protein n=1 Tax=Streptomyces blastmyceticus TaxID=68180 RepID=A0ABN0XRR4_9ACTN
MRVRNQPEMLREGAGLGENHPPIEEAAADTNTPVIRLRRHPPRNREFARRV